MIPGEKTDNWFLFSRESHKALFSELDVLLRSLDRFFYLENLPLSKEDPTQRNFYSELAAVRDVIFRILGILEVIMPESRKNAYWFQKFTESKFLTSHSRDIYRETLYKQDSPEQGINVLYDSFINLKGVVTDLLRTGGISFLSYTNIGQLISKEIRENTFFNPFRKDINPEFDTIQNPLISEIVRSIKESEVKKNISLLYLYLFRFLRYLSHIDIASQHSIALNTSLLILIMLRSEMSMLHIYMKNTGDSIKDTTLSFLLKSISYQFSMETKRVYLQELKEIMREKAPQQFRGKTENSFGILKNLIEQSIVQLAQFYKPDIQGKDIFVSFTTKLFQSMKLREDVFILHRFLALLEEKAGLQEEGSDIFSSMKTYMRYFENFTFKLLRSDDYDEFASFFNWIFSMKELELNKILEKIHNFKIFLETTLRHIANRDELKDKPIDTDKAEELLKQYL
ncbi:MAG: hypothetical protein WA126_10825 [Thermodesulfovibrionales bacterium]